VVCHHGVVRCGEKIDRAERYLKIDRFGGMAGCLPSDAGVRAGPAREEGSDWLAVG